MKSKLPNVNSLARVFPYVWPYRRKVYLSIGFALLVALLWGLNLSVAYPVVKVLLQGQKLTDYVAEEIASAEEEIARRMEKVKHLEHRLAEIPQLAESERVDSRMELIREQSREQSKLGEATRRLQLLGWLRAYVLTWLPSDQFDMLALILGVLLAATVIKGSLVFVQDVLVGSVVELTVISIREDLLKKTLALDYQSLSNAGTPELMSRFTYDVTMLATGLRLLGGKVIREPLKAAACIGMAFFVCWQLTLLSLLAAPLAVLIFARIGKKLKQASHRLMESMSRIYKTLEETFDGLKVVIAFNASIRHRKQFHRENKVYYGKSLKLVKIDALTSPTVETLGFLAAFAALLPGCYLVLRQTSSIWGVTLTSRQMDIAELSLLYVLLAGVIDPARKLSTTYTKLKRGMAAADRVFQLIDRVPLVRDPAHPTPLPRHTKSIEFRNVHFTYASELEREDTSLSRTAVLDDVCLTVNAGEVIAVVGANGSGKSTLVNLLPRYFDPTVGAVVIDGVDIRDARLTELRRQIGVVTQETLLFDDTIANNIAYGKRDATEEEIEHAAKQAYVTQFVEQFPEGLHTRVGEKGSRLSGGQRQRIALARAIIRNPSILILDEATSAIDANSELLIHQALLKFVKGRTVFIITHSVTPAILDFVTRIVVMEKGRVLAAGKHEELIETCDAYQTLYHAQVQRRSAA